MKTQRELNILKLPAYCYGKLPIDGSIIMIRVGETGYYPVFQQPILKNNETIDDFINKANEQIGVTIPQRYAMESGSMFDWGVKAANPDVYEANGKYKREFLNRD